MNCPTTDCANTRHGWWCPYEAISVTTNFIQREPWLRCCMHGTECGGWPLSESVVQTTFV